MTRKSQTHVVIHDEMTTRADHRPRLLPDGSGAVQAACTPQRAEPSGCFVLSGRGSPDTIVVTSTDQSPEAVMATVNRDRPGTGFQRARRLAYGILALSGTGSGEQGTLSAGNATRAFATVLGSYRFGNPAWERITGETCRTVAWIVTDADGTHLVVEPILDEADANRTTHDALRRIDWPPGEIALGAAPHLVAELRGSLMQSTTECVVTQEAET